MSVPITVEIPLSLLSRVRFVARQVLAAHDGDADTHVFHVACAEHMAAPWVIRQRPAFAEKTEPVTFEVCEEAWRHVDWAAWESRCTTEQAWVSLLDSFANAEVSPALEAA